MNGRQRVAWSHRAANKWVVQGSKLKIWCKYARYRVSLRKFVARLWFIPRLWETILEPIGHVVDESVWRESRKEGS